MTPFANRERIPLTGTIRQKFVDISGNEFFWDIQINQKIGEGRSCLCYDVEVKKGPRNRQRMILKQFYPEPGTNEINVILDGTEMTIPHLHHRPDVQRLGEQFEEAFELQNQLSSEIDQVVKPSVNYFEGATKLVLYEVNSGESLDRFIKEKPHSLLEMLDVVTETAEALHSLHKIGYLYMDLKPENILWNHKSVKLFDFDAAINMNDSGKVFQIAHDGRKEKEQHLAPELRNMDDKRLFLAPSVDVYSLGCILFAYIMERGPSDEECLNPGCFKDEFHEMLYEIYDDLLDYEQQEELYKILATSISYRIDRRYEFANEFAEDLKKLCAKIKSLQKKRLKPADNNILASYVLDEYPVCDYKKFEDGKAIIDVAVVGEHSIREDFVKHIFSCAQMLDTQLNIRVIAPDASKYLETMLEKCPQLKDTTSVYLNGAKYIDLPINQKITEEPFANFYFYESNVEKETIAEVVPEESRYVILADKSISKNKALVVELLKKAGNSTDRLFVGYGKRGNGGVSVLTDVEAASPKVLVQAFCCDANLTKREKLFKTAIYKKALAVHTFYTKQWNEKAERSEIEKDLHSKDPMGNYYNLEASLRCALSIKYKFSACGIPHNIDNAKVFYERVLLQDSEESTELYQMLTYLEHRSWMCFTIMQGYRNPTEEELEEYFFRDRNDHRNKQKKLHPCICATKMNPKKLLQNLSYNQWDNASEDDCDYDELDRVSLKMHKMADARAKEVNLEKEFDELEAILRSLRVKEDALLLKKNLQKIAERMLGAESEINIVWERAFANLRGILKDANAKDALDILEKMNYEMKVVKERNLYHDYRSSDATVIDGIPKIIMNQQDVIRRIYKTPSKNIGDLIISTVLMEPNELVLLTDKEESLVMEQEIIIKTFLQNRGLQDVEVSHCPFEKVKKGKTAKAAVMDITGSEPEIMMKVFKQGLFSTFPVLRCEDGKIVPEENADAVRYYLQPRHLTVEETLSLFDTDVLLNENTNYMMSLSHIYQELWKAYIEIDDDKAWKEAISLFQEEEKKMHFTLPEFCENEKMIVRETESVFALLLEISGIETVLEELKRRNYLHDFLLPPKQVSSGKIILEGPMSIVKYVQDMVRSVNQDISRKYHIEGNGIHCETLLFQATVETCKVTGLQKVLNALYENGQMDNQEYILQKASGRPFISSSGDGRYTVNFEFANRAVKQSLLQEENVLEVFVYHSLLQKSHLYDVKTNVIFRMGNKLNFVCTKGIQTFFILCTQEEPGKEVISEIKYYADYYGINSKAILLCTSKNLDESIRNRCKAMNVFLVDRDGVGQTEEDICNGKLAKVIDEMI